MSSKANGGHQAVLGEDEGIPAVQIQGPAQDDVPMFIRRHQVVDGAPGAHVVPAHVHRHHRHVVGLFHDAVVQGNIGEAPVSLGQRFRGGARGDALKALVKFGEMAGQGL